MSQDWLDLLVDDAMFHVGAGLVKYEHNKLINPESPSPKEVSSHKAEALKIIMQRLQESGGILDNTTLIAIVFLPFIDVRCAIVSCFKTKICRIFHPIVKHTLHIGLL